MKIRCDKCGKRIKRSGGLLFGPPDMDGKSKKEHLCIKCYADARRLLKLIFGED